MGYKNALHSALFIGVALSIVILLFLRSKPKDNRRNPIPPMNLMQLLNSLKVVLMNPQMWLIGIIGCLFYLPASVFLTCGAFLT